MTKLENIYIPAAELNNYIGRELWTRPLGCSDTTPSQWCTLIDVETIQDPSYGLLIQPWIQWGDEPTLMGTPAMRLMVTNTACIKPTGKET